MELVAIAPTRTLVRLSSNSSSRGQLTSGEPRLGKLMDIGYWMADRVASAPSLY
jgi:hypothetical protein